MAVNVTPSMAIIKMADIANWLKFELVVSSWQFCGKGPSRPRVMAWEFRRLCYRNFMVVGSHKLSHLWSHVRSNARVPRVLAWECGRYCYYEFHGGWFSQNVSSLASRPVKCESIFLDFTIMTIRVTCVWQKAIDLPCEVVKWEWTEV